MLSKSSILKGTQCEKQLWLYRNRPELQDPETEEQLARYELGNRIGELAQDLFPHGFHATRETGIPNETAIQLTREKIEQGVEVIYEACFSYDQVLVAVDILAKTTEGWNIYEVKSSTETKEEHYMDAAVQWWVLNNCGIHLNDVYITHINNKYVRRGELDVQQLFTHDSLRQAAMDLSPSIPGFVDRFKRLLERNAEPEIDLDVYCEKPFKCRFKGYCWRHIPENSVFDIYRLQVKSKFNFYHSGVVRIDDIPENYRFSNTIRIQIESYKNNLEIIDSDAIKNELSGLIYPLYYLDFEGLFDLAIPLFDNSKPYQQIPFQYSLHIERSAGAELEHKEFLAEVYGDPRIPFIENLIKDLGEKGSIIVYNKGYESTILRNIASDFPAFYDSIEAIQLRLWDLMKIFQKRWFYKPEMHGSWSIKTVLPALVPDLSYDQLEIQNGGMASRTYYKMVMGEEPGKPYDEIHRDLLEYCKMDTLAMVRIMEVLNNVS